ncbi:MAG: hypothetical protein AAF714_12760 [Pseudomonadota bacterium]
MFGNDKHAQAGRGLFMSSITGLANLLAVVVAFLGTPPAYGRSIDYVQTLTAASYGNGFQDLVAFAWFWICAGLIFFLARASIGTALVFGGLAIATRFM